MNEAARFATDEDIPRLADLVRQSHVEFGSQRGGTLYLAEAASPDDHRLLSQLADPQCTVLAGTIDDVVVGLATAQLIALEGYGVVARIGDLFVEPDAREVGVGAALVQLLTTWAHQHTAMGLDATVLPGNRASKNFFEAHGLVARAILVHQRFDAPHEAGP